MDARGLTRQYPKIWWNPERQYMNEQKKCEPFNAWAKGSDIETTKASTRVGSYEQLVNIDVATLSSHRSTLGSRLIVEECTTLLVETPPQWSRVSTIWFRANSTMVLHLFRMLSERLAPRATSRSFSRRRTTIVSPSYCSGIIRSALLPFFVTLLNVRLGIADWLQTIILPFCLHHTYWALHCPLGQGVHHKVTPMNTWHTSLTFVSFESGEWILDHQHFVSEFWRNAVG